MKRTKVKLTEEKIELTVSQQILLEKYKLLVTQIIHWDTHFWNKSKFFLAIETALLGVVGTLLSPFLKEKSLIPVTIHCLTFTMVFFNLYLCYVWYKTNKRNLQYRSFKIGEFLEIEKRIALLTIFTETEVKSKWLPETDSSAKWEKHLPAAFATIWGFVLYFLCK